MLALHFDRDSTNSNSERLKVTQEAFIFKNENDEKQNKLGFLWRECSIAKGDCEIDEAIRQSCKGIIRFLECAMKLNSLLEQKTLRSAWQVVGDNVAIKDEQYVYKIFDNRFYPTQRKFQNWISGERDSDKMWLENLNVKKRFEFQETTNDNKDFTDYLGYPEELSIVFQGDQRENEDPPKKRRRSFSSADNDFMRATPYGWGSVVIIQYNYQHGTHFAPKLSDFQKIAQIIQQMHAKDIVHGDVRAFNMLHPRNSAEDESGIKESCLIDFDFSGKAGVDKYPLGFKDLIVDRLGTRAGSAGEPLQKKHDWIELAHAMQNFRHKSFKAWSDLKMKLVDGDSDSDNPVQWFDDFIQSHGDELDVDMLTKDCWNKRLNK